LQNIKAHRFKDSRRQLAHFGFIKFSGCAKYGLDCNNAHVNEFVWDEVRKSKEIQQQDAGNNGAAKIKLLTNEA